jgi:hypothetical protein
LRFRSCESGIVNADAFSIARSQQKVPKTNQEGK